MIEKNLRSLVKKLSSEYSSITMFRRPENEEDLQRREAIGVIRASRFVRRCARSHKPITLKTVCEIHKEIFRDAWPEIAGVYRDENLKITDSKHLPPHYSKVSELMEQADSDLAARLKRLEKAEGILLDMGDPTDKDTALISAIITTAAWLHHLLTYIHPFREGNGRTARLAANFILERYGLVGISIKVEKENKNRYRKALAQADKAEDLEPLADLIFEGLIERYEGVSVKYYDFKKKKR